MCQLCPDDNIDVGITAANARVAYENALLARKSVIQPGDSPLNFFLGDFYVPPKVLVGVES
jgi:hypothetical protein